MKDTRKNTKIDINININVVTHPRMGLLERLMRDTRKIEEFSSRRRPYPTNILDIDDCEKYDDSIPIWRFRSLTKEEEE